MSARDIEVTCPCCRSRLEVDVRTGHVVKWRRETELDETGKPKLRESDWDDASQRVRGRLGSAESKFDSGLAREQRRSQDLDELFRKAKEKLDQGDEDEPAGS